MSIFAETADGVRHEFPDGTSPDVIDGAIADYVKSSAAPTAPATSQQTEYDAAGNPTGGTVAVAAAPDTPYGTSLGNAVGAIANGVNVGMRQVADGATFGVADKVAARMGSLLPGSPSYDDALKAERAQTEGFAQANPITAGALRLAGGALTGGGMVSNGATVAGRVAADAPLWFKAATMGVEGAGYGAADRIGHVDDGSLGDYGTAAKEGAAGGFLVGGGIPIAGRAIGKSYEFASPFVQRVIPGASRSTGGILANAATADQAGLGSVLGLGPDAMLADAGPSFLGTAQGVVTKPGEGKTALVTALADRQAGRSDRLLDDVTQNLGPTQAPRLATQDILAERQAVTGPMYQQALGNAPPIDTSNVLATIGQRLNTAEGAERSALLKARDMLMTEVQGVPFPKTDAQRLHNVKGELDNLIQYGDPGLGVPAGSLNREQGAIKQVRRGLNEALETQVPGYGDANALSREYAQRAGQLEDGFSDLDRGKTTIWPDELTRVLSTLSPEARAARTAGARADVEVGLRTNPNDLAALKQKMGGEGDFNRDKASILFGDEPTQNVLDAINREQRFSDTYADIARNSMTAQRLGGAKVFDEAKEPFIPKNATLTGLLGYAGEQAARGGFKALASARSDAARDEVGRIMSATGPTRDAVVQALLDNATRRAATRQTIEGVVSTPALVDALASAYARRNGPTANQGK